MKITEATCVSDELCHLKEEKEEVGTNREFRQFTYKACTVPYIHTAI